MVDRAAEGGDTWYVDLVSVEQNGSSFAFRDLYVDVMVPMDGRHHRLLDLDEFADAIDSGVLSATQATDALRRWQRFLDRHLHTERAPSETGPTSRQRQLDHWSICGRSKTCRTKRTDTVARRTTYNRQIRPLPHSTSAAPLRRRGCDAIHVADPRG